LGRKIPHSFIQELLSRIDIVEVVSRYIPLKQVGRNFVALCPFHPEKTPSFVVSPDKQIFKCFGCGAGGNAITFLEKYENLSFTETVRKLAALAGLELPEEFSEEEFSEVLLAGERIARFFHSKVEKVKDYLEKRKIPEREVERFLLGFAPAGYLKELGVEPDIAKELGIAGTTGKEFFAGRLIIPIFNHKGAVVAFAGRTLEPEREGPKYINSPESKLFKKSAILYGFYQSRDAVLKEKKVVVVEGYFDVISLHTAGVRNAVAPMGTSLTENHARVLARYGLPILMFDGDSAGVKATVRSAGLFLKAGKEPLVAPLPPGEDPDSMAVKNSERLKEILSAPLPFLEWLVHSAKSMEEAEKPLFFREVARAVVPLEVVDPFLFRRYTLKLSAEFGIDERWLKLNSYRVKEEERPSTPVPVPSYERAFIKALLEGRYRVPLSVSPNIFVSEDVSRLYSVISSYGFEDPVLIQSEFPELSGFVSDVLLSEFSEEEMRMAVCRVASKELERRLKRLKSLDEKRALKRFIFSLKKGNIEVLNSVTELEGGGVGQSEL
jgi:DNA primase